FMATGADGVEDLVLHAQHARHQVEMATDQLRLEQFSKAPCIQRAAVEDGFVSGRAGIGTAVPATHELLEVDVADFRAVEPLHAGGDRTGYGCEHVDGMPGRVVAKATRSAAAPAG